MYGSPNQRYYFRYQVLCTGNDENGNPITLSYVATSTAHSFDEIASAYTPDFTLQLLETRHFPSCETCE